MSRPIRVEYEGAFYHIIQRGIERRYILKEERDKKKLLECLSKTHQKYGARIHAYCIMDNHYHFIIETPRANIKQIMHSINTSYAVFYNKRHRRVGPLFQGRYKSYLVQNDEYLWDLSRYIHNNPVRAKIVEKAEDYRWSSYRCYIGREKSLDWLEDQFILKNFGKGSEARRKYREFVESKVYEEEEIKEKIKIGFIFGGADFAKYILETYLKDRIEEDAISEMRAIREEFEFSKQEIENVVKGYISEEKDIRKTVIYFLRKYTSMSNVNIAKEYTSVGKHAICKMYYRLEDQRVRDKVLDKVLKKIEKVLERG